MSLIQMGRWSYQLHYELRAVYATVSDSETEYSSYFSEVVLFGLIPDEIFAYYIQGNYPESLYVRNIEVPKQLKDETGTAVPCPATNLCFHELL